MCKQLSQVTLIFLTDKLCFLHCSNISNFLTFSPGLSLGKILSCLKYFHDHDHRITSFIGVAFCIFTTSGKVSQQVTTQVLLMPHEEFIRRKTEAFSLWSED